MRGLPAAAAWTLAVRLAVLGLPAAHLSGCFWVVAGGAAEGGYVASKDQKAGTTISDQWITTKVKSKLIADDQVKARNINVDTSKGVVTLRGIVFSSKEARRAVALARETKGVKKVLSHLKVTD